VPLSNLCRAGTPRSLGRNSAHFRPPHRQTAVATRRGFPSGISVSLSLGSCIVAGYYINNKVLVGRTYADVKRYPRITVSIKRLKRARNVVSSPLRRHTVSWPV
jgi:hypothetical protein